MSRDPFTPRDFPDHHDAELVLRLYDLRREGVMRESRAALTRGFLPRSVDDVMAIYQSDHPLNAAWRQVTSYWEMAYSLAKYGIVHPDFLMESGGEGLFFFARVSPFIAEFREKSGNTRAFANTEWMLENSAIARAAFERQRKRVEQMLASSK